VCCHHFILAKKPEKTLVGIQLSDSVFELYKPESIAVGLGVVFIHGLEHGNCGDAFWKTWLARDGTPNNVWPRTWRPDEFQSFHFHMMLV
jgi:hypothetical protein